MNMLGGAITLLTAISVVLLVVLLVVYFRNLKQVRSKLLIGLIVFAFVFLIQNFVTLYFFLSMLDYYVPAVEVHIFLFSLLQTIGFSILLWITWD